VRCSANVAVFMVLLGGCHRAPSTVTPARPQFAVGPSAFVEVAVTVDDLPVHGPAPTDGDRARMVGRLLSAFQAHHVPRVYGFVNGGRTEGGRVAEAPDVDPVLRQWVGAGHPVGNHTWSHVSLLKTPLPDYFADIERNEPLLEGLMREADVAAKGLSWKMFRYPYLFQGDTLETHDGVRAYLQRNGYQIAEVTIDGEDWAFNEPFARCAARGDRGALVQLHQTFVSVHVDELRHMREVTRQLEGREVRHVLLLHAGVADADAIDDLLTAYEKEGVRWVDLPTALGDPFYAHDPAQPVRFGAALPYLVARARKVAIPPSAVPRELGETLKTVCPDARPATALARR
jgi:peptidoglycan-N-acetylglucosamine deacetylase